jgi:hypothetical protein
MGSFTANKPFMPDKGSIQILLTELEELEEKQYP